MRRASVFIGLSILVLCCLGTPEDVVSPGTPNDESGPLVAQLKDDMIGRTFLYFHRGSDPNSHAGTMTGTWTPERRELRNFTVLRRFPDLEIGRHMGGRLDEIQVMVTLADADQIVRGPLVFQYLRSATGWRLMYMGPRDGDWWHDFSFERTRTSDGQRTVELTPASAPSGPSRFTPKPTTTRNPGKASAVIQGF
jgi:hypothetical protein